MAKMKTQALYDYCLQQWAKEMPSPESELHYQNAFQLLVAVMLSAQCTDKRVNLVTPALFEAYPDAEAMSKATVDDILQHISSVSYPNSKAAHLSATARKIMSDFNGEVPETVEQLTTLPGVGRKTANVVCAVLFGQPTMAVDTHIFRVAERIGLTTGSRSPLQTEKQLVKHISADLIPKAHHWILLHGRYTCTARRPHCDRCNLAQHCRFYLHNS